MKKMIKDKMTLLSLLEENNCRIIDLFLSKKYNLIYKSKDFNFIWNNVKEHMSEIILKLYNLKKQNIRMNLFLCF